MLQSDSNSVTGTADACSGLVNRDLTGVCNQVLLLSCFIGENTKEDLQGKKSLSEKVSLYRGDITLLEVDAIVNAGRWLNVLYCYAFKILYSAM